MALLVAIYYYHSVRAHQTRVKGRMRPFTRVSKYLRDLKRYFLHILDYFTPYMAHIMTLVPTDSKIGTF